MSLLHGTDISVPEALSLTAGALKGAAVLLGETRTVPAGPGLLAVSPSLPSQPGEQGWRQAGKDRIHL